MSKPKKEQNESDPNAAVRETILEHVQVLIEKHFDEVAKLLAESEDKAIAVRFGVKLDTSEAKPKVKTTIGFSKPYTDEVTTELDDPLQVRLL